VSTNESVQKVSRSEDLTINNDFGFRLNYPLAASGNTHFSFSGGVDFKTYAASSTITNYYYINQEQIDTTGGGATTNFSQSTVTTPTAPTYNEVYYLPFSMRYDYGWRDFLGDATLGLGFSANLWYSALSQSYATDTNTATTSSHRVKALQTITGSAESTGHWLVLTPSFSHTFELVTNWMTTLRADGQWASEPLISNEQFGAGGVNSVRGYQEGEVFGDTGWHMSLEQQTPPHTVGMIQGRIPLIVRGTLYTDYARVYLLDPKGRDDDVGLWGCGAGCVASLGTFWETRFLFSVPMLSTPNTTAYHPYFNFSLTAQF
jgi:outer membrane protein assembly factor BamA